MPPSQPKLPVAIAWYSPAQWQRWKEVVADPDNFDETHAEWQASFDHGMRYFQEMGLDPHKVPIDVEEVILWCKQAQRPIDGKARSDFAAQKLRQKYQGGSDS